ncbi:MAG: hypothetical protein RLZZ396_1725, partial [Planctomycetota bacterium]
MSLLVQVTLVHRSRNVPSGAIRHRRSKVGQFIRLNNQVFSAHQFINSVSAYIRCFGTLRGPLV